MWARPITPKGSFALAFLNFAIGNGPAQITIPLSKLGLLNPTGYQVTDGFSGEVFGHYSPDIPLNVFINPSGVVLLVAAAS